MRDRPFIYLIFMIFLQGVFVYSLMGSALYCSSSGDRRGPEDLPEDENEEMDDDTPSADEEEAPPAPADEPSLNNRCFSCTQQVADGDACGTALITGRVSDFSFYQSGNTVTLSINDAIDLTGTDEGIKLTLTNSHASYIGPGCNKFFDNISFTSDYPVIDIIESGLMGTLVYDFKKSTIDDECASFSVTDCHAVHTVTCTSGC